MDQPVLRDHELRRLRGVDHYVFNPEVLDATWPIEGRPRRAGPGGGASVGEAQAPSAMGVTILVLTDRRVSAERVPCRPCWLLGRPPPPRAPGHPPPPGLVVESGEPREVHHIAA